MKSMPNDQREFSSILRQPDQPFSVIPRLDRTMYNYLGVARLTQINAVRFLHARNNLTRAHTIVINKQSNH